MVAENGRTASAAKLAAPANSRKDKTMKYLLLSLILLAAPKVLAQETNFGVYSNLSASDGHFSGFEIFYVPNSKVVFQMAEGWPKDPIILDMGRDNENGYVASHPEMGKMIFEFDGDRLRIIFSDINYTQELTKGKSFWQQ